MIKAFARALLRWKFCIFVQMKTIFPFSRFRMKLFFPQMEKLIDIILGTGRKKNPGWVGEESLHSPRTTVWAAIWKRGIYSPFFFDENVTSQSCFQMLKEWFWFLVESKGLANMILFMQDGAPLHWGLPVRIWFDNLANRWTGRSSSNMPWPPRSPDFNFRDFFLWGFIKSTI